MADHKFVAKALPRRWSGTGGAPRASQQAWGDRERDGADGVMRDGLSCGDSCGFRHEDKIRAIVRIQKFLPTQLGILPHTVCSAPSLIALLEIATEKDPGRPPATAPELGVLGVPRTDRRRLPRRGVVPADGQLWRPQRYRVCGRMTVNPVGGGALTSRDRRLVLRPLMLSHSLRRTA